MQSAKIQHSALVALTLLLASTTVVAAAHQREELPQREDTTVCWSQSSGDRVTSDSHCQAHCRSGHELMYSTCYRDGANVPSELMISIALTPDEARSVLSNSSELKLKIEQSDQTVNYKLVRCCSASADRHTLADDLLMLLFRVTVSPGRRLTIALETVYRTSFYGLQLSSATAYTQKSKSWIPVYWYILTSYKTSNSSTEYQLGRLKVDRLLALINSPGQCFSGRCIIKATFSNFGEKSLQADCRSIWCEVDMRSRLNSSEWMDMLDRNENGRIPGINLLFRAGSILLPTASSYSVYMPLTGMEKLSRASQSPSSTNRPGLAGPISCVTQPSPQKLGDDSIITLAVVLIFLVIIVAGLASIAALFGVRQSIPQTLVLISPKCRSLLCLLPHFPQLRKRLLTENHHAGVVFRRRPNQPDEIRWQTAQESRVEFLVDSREPDEPAIDRLLLLEKHRYRLLRLGD